MGSVRRLMIIAGSGSAAVAAYASLKEQERETAKHDPWHDTSRPPITRKQQLTALRSGSPFDILVIGGARGARRANEVVEPRQWALGGRSHAAAARRGRHRSWHRPRRPDQRPADGARRGRGFCQRDELSLHEAPPRRRSLPREGLLAGELPVLFSAATRRVSARCARTLSDAARPRLSPLLKADLGQLNLVLEALKERSAVLRNAPHITNPLPTIMPCYRLWEVRSSPPRTHASPTLRASRPRPHPAAPKTLRPASTARRYPTSGPGSSSTTSSPGSPASPGPPSSPRTRRSGCTRSSRAAYPRGRPSRPRCGAPPATFAAPPPPPFSPPPPPLRSSPENARPHLPQQLRRSAARSPTACSLAPACILRRADG